MMTSLADCLSSFFVSRSLIPTEEKHIYTYCFEVVISSILAWGSVICIALFTDTLVQTAFYLAGFFLFRSFAGGYHADTHLGCYVLSILAYSFFLLVVAIFPAMHYLAAVVVFQIFAFILLWLFSPVDHKNNPFSDELKMLLRKKVKILLIVFSMLVLLLIYYNYTHLAFYLSYGCLQAAISVAVAYILKRKEEKA